MEPEKVNISSILARLEKSKALAKAGTTNGINPAEQRKMLSQTYRESRESLDKQFSAYGLDNLVEVSEEANRQINPETAPQNTTPEVYNPIVLSDKTKQAELAIETGGVDGRKVLDELIDVHCKNDNERAYYALYIAVHSKEPEIKKYAIALRVMHFPLSMKASLAGVKSLANKGEIDAAYTMQLYKECGVSNA